MRRMVLLAWFLASAGLPLAAAATEEAALCERAVAAGARGGGVPPDVLHAITLTETGRRAGGALRPWPWAVNREGRGHWFASRGAALDFARRSLAEGRRSFDVGCFQINHHWHGDAFASLEAMFDPATGADYAARFLRSLFEERGDWSQAAGAYHSRTPTLAARYRARFDAIRAGLDGAAPLVAEAAPAAPRKSRTRMSSRPLVITIERARPAPAAEASAPRDGRLGAQAQAGTGAAGFCDGARPRSCFVKHGDEL